MMILLHDLHPEGIINRMALTQLGHLINKIGEHKRVSNNLHEGARTVSVHLEQGVTFFNGHSKEVNALSRRIDVDFCKYHIRDMVAFLEEYEDRLRAGAEGNPFFVAEFEQPQVEAPQPEEARADLERLREIHRRMQRHIQRDVPEWGA